MRRLALRCSSGKDRRARSQGPAPGASGLGLRGRQQDEHGAQDVGRAVRTGRACPVVGRLATMAQRKIQLGRRCRESQRSPSAPAAAARRFDGDPRRARRAGGVPGRGRSPRPARRSPAPRLPERDETAVPFFTIDPPGSMDLDQAMHIERTARATASATPSPTCRPSCVAGGAVDPEARRRGQTHLRPDARTPLHPADAERGCREPAARRGAPGVRLGPAPRRRRATARPSRSTARWCAASSATTTSGVQRRSTPAPPTSGCVLLKEVGERRIALERGAGGASLPMPEQEVDEDEDGRLPGLASGRRCRPRTGTPRSR